MQAQVVVPTEAAVVDVFARKIRRVAVEKAALAVVVANQDFKILILDHHILAALGKRLHQPEQAADAERLAGKGLAAAGVAVTQQL